MQTQQPLAPAPLAPPPAPPAAPPAPTMTPKAGSPRSVIPTPVSLSLTQGILGGSSRIVIYGCGGIGKSTAAAYLPQPLILDVERSTNYLGVLRDVPLNWAELRGKLAFIEANPLQGVRTIVIDSATVAEEFAKEFVIQTRKNDNGNYVDSIEGFGWGKGFQYAAEEFNGLLADLDRVAAKGLNVALICHDTTTEVPNPFGEDFLRYEPHLYAGDKKGRGSVRERLIQWTDHLVFLSYDVSVKDGKGRGSGTRSATTKELPTHRAKSRSQAVDIPFEIQDPGAIWRALGIV